MNRLTVTIFSLLIAMVLPAQADDGYRSEVELSYLTSEDDDDSKMELTLLSGTYYLTPVESRDHPRAEAVFLERAANVAFAVGQQEASESVAPFPDIKSQGENWALGYQHMAADSDLYAEAFFINLSDDYDSPYDGDSKSNVYGLSLGAFLQKNLLVYVDYTQNKTDMDIPVLGLDDTFTYKETSIATKYVAKLANGRAYNLEAMLTRESDEGVDETTTNHSLELLANYYLNRDIGIGASFLNNNGQDHSSAGRAIGLELSAFITPKIAVVLAATQFSARSDDGVDSKDFALSLKGRF